MSSSFPRVRRILYVGDLSEGGTCLQRLKSFNRLGQNVRPLNIQPYKTGGRAINWLRYRYPFGPFVSRINHDLLKTVADYRPDVVWFDKPVSFTAETMHTIKKAGAQIAFYVQDAPFGPRNDGCWRQFMRVYRMADLHCLFREADIPRYSQQGLPYIKIMLSFDPQLHFPPEAALGDSGRDRGVSYIGFPYEQRPAFLLKLARDYRLPVHINGDRWLRVLTKDELGEFIHGEYLPQGQYRSGIWRSKINLSFVTEANEEDIAHKAVEIAGCGGFLMALRTPGHQAILEEDREAVYFSSVEECADKCGFYLGRPDLRGAIAARGRERAVRSGYDNDTQLARVLNRLDGKES